MNLSLAGSITPCARKLPRKDIDLEDTLWQLRRDRRPPAAGVSEPGPVSVRTSSRRLAHLSDWWAQPWSLAFQNRTRRAPRAGLYRRAALGSNTLSPAPATSPQRRNRGCHCKDGARLHRFQSRKRSRQKSPRGESDVLELELHVRPRIGELEVGLSTPARCDIDANTVATGLFNFCPRRPRR